jgi:DNA-binding XRE family transcriptional regulator
MLPEPIVTHRMLTHRLQTLFITSNMDIKQKIGKRIAHLRNLKGLTQEGLGYESEIHRTYIAAVETGKRNISVEALEKVIKGLGVTFSEFFKEGVDD